MMNSGWSDEGFSDLAGARGAIDDSVSHLRRDFHADI
jgi:hypothetical protein